MALLYGNSAVNEDVVGVVDDSIHDRYGGWAVVIWGWIDPFASTLHIELRAEDYEAVLCSCFHDLQKIIGLLQRQRSDQPFIQHKKTALMCLSLHIGISFNPTGLFS